MSITSRAQKESSRSHHQGGNPLQSSLATSILLSITQQAEEIAISADTMASVLGWVEVVR